jgi:hypothetical protein
MARIDAGLAAGDPDGEVTLVWRCYQRLRSIYHAPTPEQGRRIAEQVIATFATCPVPEIARLGRTLRAWRTQILAYFTTNGVSNGGTEAIKRPDRKDPPHHPRLRQLRRLPTTHPARHRRHPTLETPMINHAQIRRAALIHAAPGIGSRWRVGSGPRVR